MADNDIRVRLSPKQEEFVYSDRHIVQFIGPMGEGKTFAGVAGLIAHAARCGKDIRAALIRDTHVNIKDSTVPSILETPFKKYISFHDDYHKMKIHTSPSVDCSLFGAADADSIQKLQGPEYAIIWIEEPAPIIEKANSGVSLDIFNMAVARAARQTGTLLRVQITQNPSDEDHWTAWLAAHPDIYIEEDGITITKTTIRIPYGENRHLNDLARTANKAAFKNDPGKYDRYVRGVEAPVQIGKPVFKSYNSEVHFAKNELPVIEGAVGIRGWDAWHHPACIIGQLVPPNRFIVHECKFEEGIGVKEMIENFVLPTLKKPKFRGKIHDWRDIGDPTMRTPDQSSTQQSAAKVLEDMLGTRFEPGPTRWAHRFEPVNSALLKNATDGKPQIIISPTAFDLHKALNGGWHWKTDNSGRIMGSLPVNDNHCDMGNAFAYPVSVLFPNRPARKKSKVDTQKLRRMVNSYASARSKTGAKDERGMERVQA